MFISIRVVKKKEKTKRKGAPPDLRAMSPSHLRTSVKENLQTRHNLRMTTNQELPDEVLSAMAIEWRKKALEGELHARGIAHELETELRRRAGAPFTNYDTLDLRPWEMRSTPRRWWTFWRGR
ncbi:hypothetical protein ACFJIS_14895 [Variovorax boronicumulans]|uniref:hypothetical protein n=1 Tax=Variovorax boronicumulans TaxID=436515 RepID=UPI0036F23DA4